jgi:hypothetical protein
MVVRIGKHGLTPPEHLQDFESFFKMVQNRFRDLFTVKQGSIDAMGIYLFLCLKDKQEIIWRDYLMSDLEKDLPHVVLEINLLIHDPKAEYFVVASGDMKQVYNNSTLNIYIDRDHSNGILSIAGKSRERQYINNTYRLVRDATSRVLRLEKI